MVNQNELSYDMLWQACQAEKRSNELQLLHKGFYEDMTIMINGLQDATADSISLKENATKLLSGLFERRKQKIMIYVAYGRQLPTPAPQREEKLYEDAVALLNGSTLAVQGKAATGALRAIQPIPEIILPSGRKIGPLEKDQMMEIKDREDRAFLVNNNICREA